MGAGETHLVVTVVDSDANAVATHDSSAFMPLGHFLQYDLVLNNSGFRGSEWTPNGGTIDTRTLPKAHLFSLSVIL